MCEFLIKVCVCGTGTGDEGICYVVLEEMKLIVKLPDFIYQGR